VAGEQEQPEREQLDVTQPVLEQSDEERRSGEYSEHRAS
jgi:hypothetical protein